MVNGNDEMKEQMREQMVIDFNSQQVKTTQSIKKSTRDVNKEKIELAKQYGEEELKKFEEYTRDYMEKVSYLSITWLKELPHLVEEMFLNNMTDDFLAPIIRGEEIPGIPKETYKEVRKTVFLDLIKSYIDK